LKAIESILNVAPRAMKNWPSVGNVDIRETYSTIKFKSLLNSVLSCRRSSIDEYCKSIQTILQNEQKACRHVEYSTEKKELLSCHNFSWIFIQ
jgi:hypothetical protein